MSDESIVKKPKVVHKIGTHDGTFHCDEVLACYLLKQLPEFRDADIVRSRDPDILKKCDILVDVGGTYDEDAFKFDHHQRSFNESMHSLCPAKKWTTKLSSAGLIYFHFGKRILAQLLDLDKDLQADEDILDIIYDKIYENFIEEIDAIDNGINQTTEEPRYTVSTSISRRVGHLNPCWNEKEIDVEAVPHKRFSNSSWAQQARDTANSKQKFPSGNIVARFKEAMKRVGEEFLDRVMYYRNSWIPAREVVRRVILKRVEVDKSGRIILFDQGGCPWKDHLMTLEQELHIEGKILYVLFKDQNKKWRIQCVPKKLGNFENRLSLPKDWRGFRDEELSELAGIPGCIFVHSGGFTGGNETYSGILAMARKSLQEATTNET